MQPTVVRSTVQLTLTVAEAASVLRISRSSTYEAVRLGEIPAVRIGHRIVVPSIWIAEQLGVPIELINVNASVLTRRSRLERGSRFLDR